MGFRAKLPFPTSVFDPRTYENSDGNTECAEFVRRVTGLPHTRQWIPGEAVKGNRGIPLGTAIAIFDALGHYTSKHGGTAHTAIYISQGAVGIVVVDQSNDEGQAKPHLIKFSEYHTARRPTGNGDLYRVVELMQPKLL